jgi:hypothetical protein
MERTDLKVLTGALPWFIVKAKIDEYNIRLSSVGRIPHPTNSHVTNFIFSKNSMESILNLKSFGVIKVFFCLGAHEVNDTKEYTLIALGIKSNLQSPNEFNSASYL